MLNFESSALVGLIKRYRDVFRAAWAQRVKLDSSSRLPYELAFQPAHLELIETPVHPAPLWAIRMIAVLTLLAVMLAIFGKLDIVATAKGKLVPNAQVKIIQPAVTGVVREIAVHDGQRVTSGQVLMKLDTTQAVADEDKATASKFDSALAAARAQALLSALKSNDLPKVARIDGVGPERQFEAQRIAEGAWLEFRDKLTAAQAELAKRVAELDGTRAEIAKLSATAPLARDQANDYRTLAADQYVAKHDWLDKEQTAIGQEHELAAQRSHARELASAIAEQRADIQAAVSQFRREQLDALEKANEQLAQSKNDETKAHTRASLMSLAAPVSGTVQQLAVHTLGGVVTTAKSIMEIVPDDALEVEATIENKDIGFVKTGQRAAVKVESFPYTRYGLLEGEVISVANDAAQSKREGLVFTARIRLKTNRIRIDDRWVALTPGMAVTADIRTGKQSVAQYFLGPLMESAQESLHER
ncbi:HlyD family type I secretion periplasmic adaptor subunit [Burkholderia contaminans]|uniref:HlyD family type I secretion periplasmic adaptor subunit n=1 Tax=Burkholderia contaminans TaxID=488447 RepID=UPI002415C0BF|nr:HlyD family type I secretion periplasmic adaptor subunit [Burkholderia contaminans]WFN14443.1 HlyD family type I secretion periplasmic adaptor subunit [Burkholderia contaminans]